MLVICNINTGTTLLLYLNHYTYIYKLVPVLFRDNVAVSFCRGLVRPANYSVTIFCQSFEYSRCKKCVKIFI